MTRCDDTQQQVVITQSEDDTPVTIQRKDVDEAPKVLGCMMAADGTWTQEAIRWATAASEFAAKVKRAKFDRTCGSKLYSVMWIPKFRYVAPVTGFSLDECAKIESQVIRKCMAATGFCSNFPRFVVFATGQFGGMGWLSMYTTQIIEKVSFFLKNVRNGTRLGKLFRIVCENLQLFTGIKENILDTKVDWTQWAPNGWVPNLWHGLNKMNGGIMTIFKTHSEQRVHDKHLMNIFYERDLSANELELINSCRLYLKVILLSDICDYFGTTIDIRVLECNPIRNSVLDWPIQREPTPKAKKLWKQHLMNLCSEDNVLRFPLGRWTTGSHQIWNYSLELNSNTLLRDVEGTQFIHYLKSDGFYNRLGRTTGEHILGIPIQVKIHANGYSVVDDAMR